MSRKNPQDYQVLNLNRFNEHCAVLGIKELSCYDPDKKAIERAFRKRALKTHPDKGGDPVEFKKINDAYNKLMGHIFKLEQQAEQNELAESILIEVSKASIPKWIEKMKRSYGYPKSNDCKCIIFEGPYKQFKGRSKNTGPITVVLYEDPQDGIPKLHIRSRKYMAWIAEQMLPVHMHVDKGRAIQFDQWRIAHVAEFGIEAFKTPPTPAPDRKPPPPAEPKPKRKARDSSVPKPKTRRDSEPSPCPGDIPNNMRHENKDKENQEPDQKDRCGDEFDEKKEDENDPFPKVYNMADGSYSKTGKKMKKKKPKPPKPPPPEYVYNCGHCGAGFNSMLEFNHHKTKCIPDEDFGHYAEYVNDKRKEEENKMDVDETKTAENVKPASETNGKGPQASKQEQAKTEKEFERPSDINPSIFNFLTGCTSAPTRKSPDEAAYTCGGCSKGYNSLKDYSNHKQTCAMASPATSKVASPVTVHGGVKNIDTPVTSPSLGLKSPANVPEPVKETSESMMSPRISTKTPATVQENAQAPKKADIKTTEVVIENVPKVEKETISESHQMKSENEVKVVKESIPNVNNFDDLGWDDDEMLGKEDTTKTEQISKPIKDESLKQEKENKNLKVTQHTEHNGFHIESDKNEDQMVTDIPQQTQYDKSIQNGGHTLSGEKVKKGKDISNGIEVKKDAGIDTGFGNDVSPSQPSEQKDKLENNNSISGQSSTAKVSSQQETKKKDKIKINSGSKVTKTTKPEPTPKKKIALEKEIIIDPKKKDEIVKVTDSKLKPKQEKEPDAEKQTGNIQMGSLKENLPAASKNSGTAAAPRVVTASTKPAPAPHVCTASTVPAAAQHVGMACTKPAPAPHVCTASTDPAAALHNGTACTNPSEPQHVGTASTGLDAAPNVYTEPAAAPNVCTKPVATPSVCTASTEPATVSRVIYLTPNSFLPPAPTTAGGPNALLSRSKRIVAKRKKE